MMCDSGLSGAVKIRVKQVRQVKGFVEKRFVDIEVFGYCRGIAAVLP